MNEYLYQPDLFGYEAETPWQKCGRWSPTPDGLWVSGNQRKPGRRPNEWIPMVALDNKTFTDIEHGWNDVLWLRRCARYDRMFIGRNFRFINMRIGFSGWWMTWEAKGVTYDDNGISIKLGKRLA